MDQIISNQILSEKNLIEELNKFRDVLINYDFSEVSNIIFFDINSLNFYLKTHKENPFEKQYRQIEISLDKLSPYLPISISNDTIDVITEVLYAKYGDKQLVKENILFNIKLDFIEQVRSITNENEWQNLISLCKSIRSKKQLNKEIDKVIK